MIQVIQLIFHKYAIAQFIRSTELLIGNTVSSSNSLISPQVENILLLTRNVITDNVKKILRLETLGVNMLIWLRAM
jgi:hypothetical protein